MRALAAAALLFTLSACSSADTQPITPLPAKPVAGKPSPAAPPPPPMPEEGIVCTADVRQCPDGSYVSRTPKGCAFAPCPTASKP